MSVKKNTYEAKRWLKFVELVGFVELFAFFEFIEYVEFVTKIQRQQYVARETAIRQPPAYPSVHATNAINPINCPTFCENKPV
jgi:hypothetical protein